MGFRTIGRRIRDKPRLWWHWSCHHSLNAWVEYFRMWGKDAGRLSLPRKRNRQGMPRVSCSPPPPLRLLDLATSSLPTMLINWLGCQSKYSCTYTLHNIVYKRISSSECWHTTIRDPTFHQYKFVFFFQNFSRNIKLLPIRKRRHAWMRQSSWLSVSKIIIHL